MAPAGLQEALFSGVDHPDLFTQPTAPFDPTDQVATQYIFVDPAVSDLDHRLDQVASTTRVVRLGADRNAWAQMADALEGVTGLDAIHVLSHGKQGAIELGSGLFGAVDLEGLTPELAQIGDSLTGRGDLLFWGCDVASGSDGRVFATRLAALTGADVAASTDRTGSENLGGDWDLEFQVGDIETSIPFEIEGVDDVLLPIAGPDRGAFDGAFDIGNLEVTEFSDVVTDENGNTYVTGTFNGPSISIGAMEFPRPCGVPLLPHSSPPTTPKARSNGHEDLGMTPVMGIPPVKG